MGVWGLRRGGLGGVCSTPPPPPPPSPNPSPAAGRPFGYNDVVASAALELTPPPPQTQPLTGPLTCSRRQKDETQSYRSSGMLGSTNLECERKEMKGGGERAIPGLSRLPHAGDPTIFSNPTSTWGRGHAPGHAHTQHRARPRRHQRAYLRPRRVVWVEGHKDGKGKHADDYAVGIG